MDKLTPQAPQTHAARVIAKPCAYSGFCSGCKSFLAHRVAGARVRPTKMRGFSMLLPITLTFAAACALLNLWIATRCARIRITDKVMHGDAGNSLLARRMRAHANFVEYTPIVLILFALVELAIGASLWLWIGALVYVVARVAHAFGMDADKPTLWRAGGALLTWGVMVAMSVTALTIAYGATRTMPAPPSMALRG
jgi:uncharacterized membrane protein YecN with MAPEG domain